MSRCRMAWVSPMRGPVRCHHTDENHPARHEAWPSRRERRTWPWGASWIARGHEHALGGHWLTDEEVRTWPGL